MIGVHLGLIRVDWELDWEAMGLTMSSKNWKCPGLVSITERVLWDITCVYIREH